MTKTMIVGVGPGFGLALAKKFGQRGDTVILVARNEAKLKAYQAALTGQGLEVSYFVVDVNEHKQVETLFASETDVDTVIYNVGITAPDDPIHTAPQAVDARLHTNVTSCVDVCQQYLATEHPRTILITGGGAAWHPNAYTTTLAMSKAALRSYALALHDYVATSGVYVGLMTIQGISGLGPEMAPEKVALAYLKAAEARNQAEIFYPGGKLSEVSEFDQLKELAKNPAKRAALLQAHPEFAKYQHLLS